MKCLASFLAILTLSVCNAAIAGEPGANYSHLKHLERIMGHWEYVGLDGKGRVVQGEETIQWIFNKNYVRGNGIWEVEGEKPITYELTTGWDPELKQVVMNGALSTGVVFRRVGRFDRKLNASVSTQTNIAADGTKDTMECTVKYKDNDSWLATWTKHVSAGIAVADSHIQATRVVEPFKLPKDVTKELNNLVGHWKLEGQASEGKLEGIWELRWAPGMHCLIGDYRLSVAGKQSRSSDLYCWDAITGEYVLFSAFQGGHIEISRTKPAGPGVFRGPYSVDIDGKRYEGTSELRWTGENEFRFITKGLATQGIDDLKLRGVRLVTDNGAAVAKQTPAKRTGKETKQRPVKKQLAKRSAEQKTQRPVKKQPVKRSAEQKKQRSARKQPAKGTADAEPSAYEDLKVLEPFIGVWEAETVIPKSAANSKSVKEWQGKPLKLCMTVNWTAQKNAQTIEVVHEVPGEVEITSSAIRGWDQAAKKIKEHSFTTHKGVWSGTMEPDNSTWVFTYSGYNLDGAACTGTRIFQFEDEDTMLMKDTAQTTAGEDIPDMEYRFKRVTPHYLKHKILEDLVIGTWAIRGTSDGQVVVGQIVGNWAPGKNCAVYSGYVQPEKGGPRASLSGISGWDEATGKIKEMLFSSDGSCGTALFSVQGNKMVGQRKGVDADGKNYIQDLKFSTGKDRWVGEPSTVLDADGTVLAKHGKWVFTRK